MVSKTKKTNLVLMHTEHFKAIQAFLTDYFFEATIADEWGRDAPRSVAVLDFGTLANWVTILRATFLLFQAVASLYLLNWPQLFVMLTDFLWRQFELPVELMSLNNIL